MQTLTICQVCMKFCLCFFQLTKEYELQAGEATPTPLNIQYWKLHVQQMSNFPMNILFRFLLFFQILENKLWKVHKTNFSLITDNYHIT